MSKATAILTAVAYPLLTQNEVSKMSDPTPQTEYNPNRSTNLKLYTLLALAGLATLAIFASLDSFNKQPKEIQAGAVMTIPVVLVSICGFTAIGISAASLALFAWSRRPTHETPIITQARTIPPQRQAPQLAPIAPTYQLPAPIYADIPTFTYQGKPIPYGLVSHQQKLDEEHPPIEQYIFDPEPTIDRDKVILRTRTAEGKIIEIGAKLLMRFAKCATPTRSEWTGDKKYYGICAEYAAAQGILTKEGTGYKWVEGYPLETRMQWVDAQINFAIEGNPSPTPNSNEE